MKKDTTTTFDAMGRAALIPGMQYMYERIEPLMRQILEEMRAGLAGVQNGKQPKRGRPVKAANGKSGWPTDPAERSAEMVRRRAVARARKAEEQVHDRRSESAKQRWANMTEEQKKVHIAAMNKARLAKRKPAMKLAVASVAS